MLNLYDKKLNAETAKTQSFFRTQLAMNACSRRCKGKNRWFFSSLWFTI